MWFLKLIRWRNLLIITLTQLLLKYCIINPFLNQSGISELFPDSYFALLVLVTVMIAAAGYIINDYYDISIDLVNKPDKVLIGKKISLRNAMHIYLAMNIVAVIIGFFLALQIQVPKFGFIFILIASLLWFYSARFKRSWLTGNLVVASLSSFVILIVWPFEYHYLKIFHSDLAIPKAHIGLIVGYYAMFAFWVSMVREVVKDIEDMEGDRRAGCRTIPLVSGVRAAKIMAVSFTIITMLLLALGQYHALTLAYYGIFMYYLISVQILLLYLIYRISNAKQPHDFRYASSLAKIIMFAGIAGMLLFCFEI